jgi:hypothetical protein
MAQLNQIVPVVDVPEGYQGKILLVSIRHEAQELVVLRSGDLWHREILHNTQAEIKSLGFKKASVQELGGAHLSFNDNGTILIEGGSEEFGSCDHDYVASLIQSKWPDRLVMISGR